jgi:glycosyltransferase involved in cell wall biosynthesis
MNILILTSLFFPEIAANSIRMTALAEKLSADEMDVTVVTAFPYYSDSTNPKHKNRFAIKERHNGVDVVRTYTFISKEKTIYKRLLTFLSYMLSSAAYTLFKRKKFDVVLSISPPFFTLITAFFVCRIRRIPFVIDIQDLYPDTAVELGKLKNRYLIKIWRVLEVMIYKSAAAIVVISKGFKEEIVKKGIPSDKIFVVNTWVNTRKFDPDKISNQKKALGLEDSFVVLFLGTLGYAQGAENIIEAAALLCEYERIKFLFVGDGVGKNKLIEKASDMELGNVLFLPPKPFQEVPSYINSADICLVHLVKRDFYRTIIPSKTYEYMSMGKAIIMVVQGEAESLVRDNNCGIAVEPENPQALKRAILKLYENPEEAEELGRNSRLAALKYSDKVLMSKYKEIIYQVSKEEVC